MIIHVAYVPKSDLETVVASFCAGCKMNDGPATPSSPTSSPVMTDGQVNGPGSETDQEIDMAMETNITQCSFP